AVALSAGWIAISAVCRLRGRSVPLRELPAWFAAATGGLLAIALVTALVVAHGRTVLIGLLPVAVLFLYALRSGERPPARAEPRGPWRSWVFALALLLPFALFAARTLDLREGRYREPSPDDVFYAGVTASLAHTGIETNTGVEAILRPDLYRPVPYHYLEQW